MSKQLHLFHPHPVLRGLPGAAANWVTENNIPQAAIESVTKISATFAKLCFYGGSQLLPSRAAAPSVSAG